MGVQLHTKKTLLICLAAVLCIGVLLFFFLPLQTASEEAFSLQFLDFPPECTLEDELEVTAALKSHSMHALWITSGVDMISISYWEKGSERPETIVPAIGVTHYLFPYQNTTESMAIRFDHPGEYIVTAQAAFDMQGVAYQYECEAVVTVTQEDAG